MYVNKTHSTNSHLAELHREQKLPDGYHILTYCQTQGRGQVGNTWHSLPHQNVLISTLILPHNLHMAEQFILSEIVALAAQRTLNKYTQGITIKWPNDIYWHNQKIAGILIENSIVGPNIKSCIAGIGINVNQTEFPEELPNPVSLAQITGRTTDKEEIAHNFLHELKILKSNIDKRAEIHHNYCSHLFRAKGMHPYKANGETFLASIHHISLDGTLTLQKEDTSLHDFHFKEVEIII